MIIRKYIKEAIKSLLELRVVAPYGNKKEDITTILVVDGYAILKPGYNDLDDFDVETVDNLSKQLKIPDLNWRLQTAPGSAATDLFFGYINNKDKMLDIPSSSDFYHSAKSSQLIKKIVNQFKLKGVYAPTHDYDHITDDEFSGTTFKRKDILGKLPDIMYHGTSSSSLDSILKKGLVPGGTIGKSNFKAAKHYEVVSLAADISQSVFYARTATTKDSGFSGLPIILGFEIPDRSKIIADFDVDLQTSRETPEYSLMGGWSPGDARPGRGAYKTSLDVGVIGYKGRIPPSFIREVYYYNYSKKKWVKTNLRRLIKIVEKWEDFGGY